VKAHRPMLVPNNSEEQGHVVLVLLIMKFGWLDKRQR
jgi:hypothetical protein